MKKEDRIYVAGHNGMVGSAILRQLKSKSYQNLITISSSDLDLRDQKSADDFIKHTKPHYIFLAAARVGGILANSTYQADFIYDNLMIQTNVIRSAHRHRVDKLLFMGSSCVYPKHADQPLRESYLLEGPLEETNESYAVAKIAGIKLCQAYRHQYGENFIAVMPTSLYGPGDNYDRETSHVLPALLRKIHEAQMEGKSTVEIWGSGNPRREFMHVDDMASACCFLMQNYHQADPINIGTGDDISIRELAELIKSVVGYPGSFVYNPAFPDGTPRKLLDVSKLNQMGWKYKIDLLAGIKDTYPHLKRELSGAN